MEDELFFPSPPYRDFDGALTSMAVEFAARYNIEAAAHRRKSAQYAQI